MQATEQSAETHTLTTGVTMGNEIELVSDGDGIAVIGDAADIDRFFLSSGLGDASTRELDVHRLLSLANTAGSVVKAGAELSANSGRWVKLTKESAEAVAKFGLTPTNTPGVSHAMIGEPGDIKQWLQIVQAPTALLSGPFALTALSTMMQQRAMQEQMDEIVEYLEEISEKVDDILRTQKDAVLADMIGVDLVIEDALTVREEVGRVSEITWSKVQTTSMTLARTQGYAVRQLDAIAEKLEKKKDLGDLSRSTAAAEPAVREWLAVLARTFQLQDGVSILELDRVLDAAPEDLESHRLGLVNARRKRIEVIGRSTARLLGQMDETVHRANSKVLFNPFDAPSALRSSGRVATGVLELRDRLGIESDDADWDAKRWGQAVVEVRDRAVGSATEVARAAGQLGAQTFDSAAGMFRHVDTDGDGVPERPRAAALADKAGQRARDAAGTRRRPSATCSHGGRKIRRRIRSRRAMSVWAR